jgi:DDE_Tnp_1-associated
LIAWRGSRIRGSPGKSLIRCAKCCFLVVCGTIASGDDYDDIVDWGEAHLPFLRRFSEFHHGIPCTDWRRTVMNRIDPDLFCSPALVMGRRMLAAIHGSRRSHDRKRGRESLLAYRPPAEFEAYLPAVRGAAQQPRTGSTSNLSLIFASHRRGAVQPNSNTRTTAPFRPYIAAVSAGRIGTVTSSPPVSSARRSGPS